MTFGPFNTIEDVKKANTDHWFEPDTIGFFDSKVESNVVWGRYFVTSEATFDGEGRGFTLRRAEDNGRISTVGEFNQYSTAADALSVAREVAFYDVGYADGEANAPLKYRDEDYVWGYEAALRAARKEANNDD